QRWVEIRLRQWSRVLNNLGPYEVVWTPYEDEDFGDMPEHFFESGIKWIGLLGSWVVSSISPELLSVLMTCTDWKAVLGGGVVSRLSFWLWYFQWAHLSLVGDGDQLDHAAGVVPDDLYDEVPETPDIPQSDGDDIGVEFYPRRGGGRGGVVDEVVVLLAGEEDIVEGDRGVVVVWTMTIVLLELVRLELEHMRIHWMLRTRLRPLRSLPSIHIPRSQSSQDTVNLAHDGVAPQPGTMTQWLVAGMMTSYPQAASPHAFVGSLKFDQLHGTPPGSHVTGSLSGGSGSHREQHDVDEQWRGRRKSRPPPCGTGGCLEPPAPRRRGRH
ncbi:hypothetical protein PIB30_102745, partial [Stylosanthes scabra]|nr:hypothetical protein [Stylosanthes scabra]